MKKPILPADHYSADSQNVMDPISIIRYNSDVVSINARIKLRQNLFSFLLEGQKTVQYAGTEAKIDPNQFLLLSSGNCLMSEKIAAADGRYRRGVFCFFSTIIYWQISSSVIPGQSRQLHLLHKINFVGIIILLHIHHSDILRFHFSMLLY